jgi:hypothetical protein
MDNHLIGPWAIQFRRGPFYSFLTSAGTLAGGAGVQVNRNSLQRDEALAGGVLES